MLTIAITCLIFAAFATVKVMSIYIDVTERK